MSAPGQGPPEGAPGEPGNDTRPLDAGTALSAAVDRAADESLLGADQALNLRPAPVLLDASACAGHPDEAAHLAVTHCETGQGETVLIGKDVYSIGRALENDLVLDHRSISAEHAIILREDGGYVFRDLNSRNGSTVNGNAAGRVRLADDDQIEMGVYRIVCRLPGRRAAELPSRRAPVVLEFLTGGMRGINQRFVASSNDVAIGGDTLRLARRSDGWCLSHVRGREPLSIDGRAVNGPAARLRHGCEIALGRTRIRFLHL